MGKQLKKRIGSGVLLASLVAGAVSGCGTSNGASTKSSGTNSSSSNSSGSNNSSATKPTATSTSKHYTFELITKSNASPYWLAVKDGADAAAKKYGVTVKFEAPASGTDLAKQISMVNNAVTDKVDGIILAAQNPTSLVKPVKSAMAAGIPVVTVDSGVSPNVSDSFIATSNVGASKALADYMAKLVNKKGKDAIIDFNQEASTGIKRPQGWKQGMSQYSGISFAGMQLSNNDPGKAQSETENLIQSNPGLNLVFGANDRSAIGAANAVKADHLKGKVFVAGFDADMGEVQDIKDGLISASILQSPYQMGYQAVQFLLKIKKGQSVPKRVNTPYFLVTPKNINTSKATKAIQQYIPKYKG